MAARNAEKEALLAESPYVRLRDDLFARYVRDRKVVPNEGDVVVDASWVIVQPKLDDPVAVKMGAMLARFLQEVMGLELPVVKRASTDGATDGLILLKTQGGGQEGVSESFTVTVAPAAHHGGGDRHAGVAGWCGAAYRPLRFSHGPFP